ncbi:MAG: copper resistance protein [Alphaproteobacteria bacterium]|nr:copper resistance protein [Alphaproteobacteria bacterium]
MSSFRKLLAFLAILLFTVAPRIAFAMAGDWDTNEHVKVRIVSAVEAVGERDTVPLGVQFQLKLGWKIYWRSPGDAGFPPDPDWSRSKNLSGAEIAWPAPERFSILGLETLGYKDEVVFPLSVAVSQPGEALQLKGQIRYLACKEICIPYEAKVGLDVPAGPANPGEYTHLISSYVAKVPGAGDRHGLSVQKAVLLQGTAETTIQVEALSREPFVKPDLFVEGPEEVVFGKPVISLSDGGKRAVLALTGIGLTPTELDGATLVFTLVDGDRAMEAATPVRLGGAIESVPSQAGVEATASLGYMLALALLGGLILNLMPCVLPVLSIKLLSVVSYGGGNAGGVRVGFLATAAGIVASMLLIAVALIGVKAAGMTIGWGIQFQQPLFLVFMALVVTLFACNLFGLFEVQVPQRLADLSLSAGDRPSVGGHFMTGAFATLLATPCSAPFVGTAVGFALSRDIVEILLVFAALGVGLALPYLAVAAVPAIATALPRPGKWMVILRHILGLSLVATALWLLTVISVQIGVEGAFALGGMLALIGTVLIIRRLPGSRLGRHSGKAVLVLAIAALALPIVRPQPITPMASVQSGNWQPFNRAEISRLVAAGRVVFVDVTADWCITCQVNKKVVLDTEPVSEWLNSEDVVAMRADWTRPNDEIAHYLASFGRYGIPFNAVYGPKAVNGIALPELLTSTIVLDAAVKSGSDTRFVSR